MAAVSRISAQPWKTDDDAFLEFKNSRFSSNSFSFVAFRWWASVFLVITYHRHVDVRRMDIAIVGTLADVP